MMDPVITPERDHATRNKRITQKKQKIRMWKPQIQQKIKIAQTEEGDTAQHQVQLPKAKIEPGRLNLIKLNKPT